MGQRVQMHVLTQDNVFETFHLQNGLGDDFFHLFDAFYNKKYTWKENRDEYRKNYKQWWDSWKNKRKPDVEFDEIHVRKEDDLFETFGFYPLAKGDNNNGYLLIDDVNKKYAILLGHDEEEILCQKLGIEKIPYSENQSFHCGIGGSKVFVETSMQLPQTLNDLLEIHADYITPKCLKKWKSTMEEFLNTYSLMSKEEVKNFVQKENELFDVLVQKEENK